MFKELREGQCSWSAKNMGYKGCGMGLTWKGWSLFSVIDVLAEAGLSLIELF